MPFSRRFCRKRYELSKYLPDLVARLAGEDTRCYLAGYSRYATIELTLDSGEIIHYMMAFNTFREKKKLRLHVESAYPLEKRPGRMKKIKFLVIARKTLLGKEIKQTIEQEGPHSPVLSHHRTSVRRIRRSNSQSIIGSLPATQGGGNVFFLFLERLNKGG